jgi:tetratricopeptide (TPR) repeat protein
MRLAGRQEEEWLPNAKLGSVLCDVTTDDRIMLIGLGRRGSLVAVLLISTTAVLPGESKSSERGELPAAIFSDCATIAQPFQGQTIDQKTAPSSDVVLESLERALSEGKAQEAHHFFVEILNRPHPNSDVLLRAGIQFAEREMYSDATAAFQRCIHEHPDAFEAYYNLALADIAQQKWNDALATLQQAPQQSRSEILACSYLRGKVEYSQGKMTEAERDLSNAFWGAPQNPAYGMDLGLLYIQQRAYLQAATVFGHAAELNPRSAFLLLGLSLSRFLAGQNEQSLETLTKLLSMRPGFSPAEVLMTFVLSVEGRLEEAEKLARRGLSAPDASPYLYYLDASILVKLQSRQYKRMLDELSIARQKIPSCSLCYLTESKVYEMQGNSDAAIADLETATQLDPGLPEAWYRLANLYRRHGRSAEGSQAENRFEELKATKEEREVQMLRENFLQSLDAAQSAQ